MGTCFLLIFFQRRKKMNPKKALYFAIGIRMLMVLFCISICFVKFIESDDATVMDKEEKALVMAAYKADTVTCEKLFVKGVSTKGRIADGSTPLHLTALNSQGESSFSLFKKIVFMYFGEVEAKDHTGRRPLHLACLNVKNIERRNETVAWLLLCGADISAENDQGRDILSDVVTLQSRDNVSDLMGHWGCLFGKESVRKAMDLAGWSAGVGLGYTDIYEVLKKNYSIDECAKKSGLDKVVFELVKGDGLERINEWEKEGKLSLIMPEKYGRMPLIFVAIFRGEKKLAKEMLKRKSELVNPQDSLKRNVGHIVAGSSKMKEEDKIKLLGFALEKGCKVTGDINGETMLHVCVRTGQENVLSFLMSALKERAPCEQRNANGDRAIDIAIRFGRTKMVDILSSGRR